MVLVDLFFVKTKNKFFDNLILSIPKWISIGIVSLIFIVDTYADPIHYDINVHGLFDFRYVHADANRSWLDKGLGVYRYGGNDNNFFQVNEAALVLQARLNTAWTASVTGKYAYRQGTAFGISEGILGFHPVSTTAWRFNARLGAFMPPISMENNGTAWSSPYTLTNSAINTWVGEELKVFGGEAQVSYQFDSGFKVNAFGSGFVNNDTAGTLIAWRGWSFSNYVATVNESYPLTELGNPFTRLGSKQASNTKPFVEVDNRPGYYAGLSLDRLESIKIRTLYYDNRADPAAVSADGQWAWHTHFWNAGLKMDLPWQMTLIGEGMTGRTSMGKEVEGKFIADNGFWSESILLSKAMGFHRVSVRYDNFGTDQKALRPRFINVKKGYGEVGYGEQGDAWTLNYNVTPFEHNQLNFEISSVYKNRQERVLLNISPEQRETLYQCSYRIFF